MRRILEDIRMGMLKDSWPPLSRLACHALEVPFAWSSENGPTHDPKKRTEYYQLGLPTLLEIMAVHFASCQILAFMMRTLWMLRVLWRLR